jgi:spore coat polysaccharide biosynthesis predicted glycosyltransferase SpsG
MKTENISIIVVNKKGIGIGNLKRCYYLKQLLEKRFKVFPILIGDNENLFNPFNKITLKLKNIDFNLLFNHIKKKKIKKIIIDYYYFPKSILDKLKKKTIKLIKISDFEEKYDTKFYDLILNQYLSNNQDSKQRNAIIINPDIYKYRNLQKEKKITIFFGFESSLNKIINCLKAVEKIKYFKNYKKNLILFGNYKKKYQLLNKFINFKIKLNPTNFFKEISKSKFFFGEAGTAAIEREILKIISLNFITNYNQINTSSILKYSNFSYFNVAPFKNNENYFKREILNFLKRIRLRKRVDNFYFSKNFSIVKLLEKI